MKSPKVWYESKTLWLNVIAGGALITQKYSGYVVSPELQTALLILVNIIIRFVTKKPIVFRKPPHVDCNQCCCDED